MSKRHASPVPPEKRRGRPKGFSPNPPSKAPTTVRRLLYTREQTGEALGGISVSSVIRLERPDDVSEHPRDPADRRLSKVRLRGNGQVFHRVDEVEALAMGDAEGAADAEADA